MSERQTMIVQNLPRRRPDVLIAAAALPWALIRAPLVAALVVFEPIVSFVLTAFALLGILATFFFKFTGTDSRFPFWTMLGVSSAFVLAVIAYHALIRLFAQLR